MTSVRRATPGDAPGIALVQVRSWQSAYRGMIPDAVLDSLDAGEARAARWRGIIDKPEGDLLVADDAARVVGFCSMIPSRDADADASVGEIAALYVTPGAWRQGHGRALIAAAVQAAAARSYRELTLWVLRDNARAIAFYDSAGFGLDGGEKLDRREGYELHEVRARRGLAGVARG